MILSVKDKHKSYGKEKVLKGISLEIEEPQIIALIGPNGAGKSTLLNIILSLSFWSPRSSIVLEIGTIRFYVTIANA